MRRTPSGVLLAVQAAMAAGVTLGQPSPADVLALRGVLESGALEDEDTGDKVTYQIVGEDEADLKHGLINISSPIARALIGKTEGETAEVVAPGGIKRYEIMAVKYI